MAERQNSTSPAHVREGIKSMEEGEMIQLFRDNKAMLS